MEWINQRPTQAVWYWVVNDSIQPTITEVQWVYQGAQTLIPELHVMSFTPTNNDRWMGPLDVPQRPVLDVVCGPPQASKVLRWPGRWVPPHPILRSRLAPIPDDEVTRGTGYAGTDEHTGRRVLLSRPCQFPRLCDGCREDPVARGGCNDSDHRFDRRA